MLGTLIESGVVRARKPAAPILSVVVHVALITGAVLATEQLGTAVAAGTEVTLTYLAPPSQPAPTQRAVQIPLLPRGFQTLVAPMSIPDVLPAIDLTRTHTNPDAFTATGQPGGVPDGPGPGGVFTEDQVERIARLVPGTVVPHYPETLRSAGIEGEVNVEFVIDTTGLADLRTLRIVSSTHRGFTDAALRALSRARFAPAELGGRPVRQLVRMPFGFKISR